MFNFPVVIGVRRAKNLVKNIWYPQFYEDLPCRFISFNSRNNSVTIEIDFITKDDSSFKL